MKIGIKNVFLCVFAVAGMQAMQPSSTISQQNERQEELFEALYQNGCGLVQDFRLDEIQNSKHFLGFRNCSEELRQLFDSQDNNQNPNSSVVKLYRGLQWHFAKQGVNQLVIDAIGKQIEFLEALEENGKLQKRNNDQQELLSLKNEVIGLQNEKIERHQKIQKNLIAQQRNLHGIIGVLGVACIGSCVAHYLR